MTGLLLLLAAALGLLLRSVGADAARSILLNQFRSRLPVGVEIQGVQLSLWPPGLALRDVTAREGKTELFRAGEIDFRLAWMPSLWEGAWIGDLRIADFELSYRESSAIWKEAIGKINWRKGEEGEPSFIPRALILEQGRVTANLDSWGTRAAIADLEARVETGGILARSVDFSADARAVIERAGARLALRKMSVRGRTRRGRVTIEEAKLEGDPGVLQLRGRGDSREVRGTLDWNVVLDPIFALLPEAGIVSGQGNISANFAGPISGVKATTQLQARAVRIHDVEFSGAGELRSRGLDWDLVSARAQMFDGEVVGDAHGRFVSGVPFEVQGQFREWNPATFVRLFGPQTPLLGSWNGEARMEGLLFGDDLKGGGTFTVREQQETVNGRAQFVTTKNTAEVEGTVEAGAADRLHCRYRVERNNISGEVDGLSDRLSVFGPFVGLSLAGRGRARGQFAGTVEAPLFSAEAEMDALTVEGVDLGGVRGPFEISRQGFRSSGFVAADGRFRAAGRVALTQDQENDWSLRAEGAALDPLAQVARRLRLGIPDVGGRMDGDVRAAGQWSKLRLGGRIAVTDLSVATERLGSLSAELLGAPDGWSVHGDLRGPKGAKANLLVKIGIAGKLSSRLTGAGWKIEKISMIHQRWPELAGGLAFSSSIAGTMARPMGEASLEIGEMKFSGHPLGNAMIDFRLDGERALVHVRSGQRLRLEASVEIASPHVFTAQGDWRDLDLGVLLLPRSRLEIATVGNGEIRGDAGSILREGSIRLTELAMGRDRLKLVARAPVTIGIREGDIEIADLALEGEGQRLTFGGHFGQAGSAFHAEGKGDLAFLETVSPAVTSARGEVTTNLKAARKAGDAWKFQGAASIRDGAVDLGFQVSVTEITGRFRFDERRAEVQELTGKLGEGRILAEGALGLDSGWDLGWGLRDASFGFPLWLDYRASGNGRLEGPVDRPKLEGEIEVTQAVYDRRIEWAEFLPWFRREARVPRAELSLPIDLDLHVFADGGLFVDNNLAKTEMRGDFHVGGAREKPTWSGRLDVLSGEFTFRRRSFSITAGTVQFDALRPLDPDLEFRGETTVSTNEGDYQITVRVSGTAEQPRIEFTADDPSLTENDVLALVTFGRTVAQLQSQGAGIELNEVLALTAGPRAAGEVEERIFNFLPVDRIEIEPSFSRTTGATEPRLSIGKDLAQGFRALLGTGLGAERRQDVSLEYQLTRRISVQGTWESQTKSEAGAFGGELKFRFPFRNLTPFSMLPSVSLPKAEP